MADMASRISSLEKSAAKVGVEESSVPTVPRSETAISTPSTHSRTALRSDNLNSSKRAREDILVQKGSSSQYFSEILLSRVIEEVSEPNIESVLTPPQTVSPHPGECSPFNALGILSSPSSSLAPSSLHPSKQLAVRHWKTYVDNVESCAGLKLLHLPTDEVKVYSTIDDPTMASSENLSLSFAIYFASTVSLDSPEVQMTLGCDKHTLLMRYKLGLEQAFAHGDFLDRPTITGLHALAIYLSALRVHNHGKGIWILNGLAIRIAQSLGLHRDGERLGLSSFQAEIRRRLWWHLLTRDGRAGEDYGLENVNSLLLVSDVSLPANVDDTDLYPEMQRPPVAKEGWTAMTFSLINIELAKSMLKLASIAGASSSPPREDVRAQIIKETKMNIDRWLANCNPVIPQHRLTLLCSRFLLRKLDFVTRLQWVLLQRAGPHTEFATEQNLIEALEILEPRLHSEDGLLEQFAWARKAYPQYHVTMYVLWYLCVKPQGPNVDRAWRAIETQFSHELWDEATMGFGSKSAVLKALKAKALSMRERIRQHNPRGDLDVSTTSLMSGEETQEGGDVSAYPDMLGEGMDSDMLGLDHDEEEWPAWSALVEGFQLDNSDAFWQSMQA